jgi:uncharacterized protein
MPNMAVEIEAIKELYAAINRNDIAAISKLLADDVVRVEPEGFPSSGTYRGPKELCEHIQKGRDTWAEGTCTPEKFFTGENKVVVEVVIKVRLKTNQIAEGRIADGFAFRNGKITEMNSYTSSKQAFEWAHIPVNQST